MEMRFAQKKGITAVVGIILAVVMVCVILVVGLRVLSSLQADLTAASAEYNATGDLIDELADIPTWIGILIVVAIAGILIAYLGGWFGGKKRLG